jgi:hypothetical protein
MVNTPADVIAELQAALDECSAAKSGAVDFAMIFVKSHAALRMDFARLASRLQSAGMLWVSWPKKASGLATDLTENDVRRIGLETGLVDVKVCAVNEVWSGLKFVIRLKDRKKPA